MGEHGQGGPAVPGGPAADLVLVEPGEALGGLEGFLDAPALSGHAHQCAVGPGAGCSSAGRPAPRCGRCGGSAGDGGRCRRRLREQGDPRPRVDALAVAARTGGVLLPGPCRAAGRAGDRRGSARPRWGRGGWPIPPTHSPARGRARRRAVSGRRRRPRHRPPTPPGPGVHGAGDQRLRPVRVWSRNPACPGIPARSQRCGSSAHSWADTGPGRSTRAHAAAA